MPLIAALNNSRELFVLSKTKRHCTTLREAASAIFWSSCCSIPAPKSMLFRRCASPRELTFQTSWACRFVLRQEIYGSNTQFLGQPYSLCRQDGGNNSSLQGIWTNKDRSYLDDQLHQQLRTLLLTNTIKRNFLFKTMISTKYLVGSQTEFTNAFSCVRFMTKDTGNQ